MDEHRTAGVVGGIFVRANELPAASASGDQQVPDFRHFRHTLTSVDTCSGIAGPVTGGAGTSRLSPMDPRSGDRALQTSYPSSLCS
jgi:hypothetical protein